MQNSQLPTIERHLKAKILAGVVLLLLVGLHPVHVFADAGSSNTTGTSSGTSATADPTTSSDTTTSGSAVIPAGTSSSNTPIDTTNSSDTNNGSSTAGSALNTPTGSTTNDQTDSSTATVSNQTSSTANSGNTSVTGSSTGGNATSGDAQAIATAINVLNSSTDVQSNNTNTYVDNITGNSNTNDVIIDPTTTGQPIDSQDANKTEVNTASSGTIDNNVTVGASTGDANVSDDDVGGNATSGSATADANLINVVGSEFTSGQYYVGVINVLGNLSGNILLNPDFVNQLLSENPSVLLGDTSATNSINQSIDNAINASATSGDASVEHNLLGGNATSGSAETSVDSYNLVNDNITGNNALLVFINVLGTWEGVIIGAPTGATTAVYSDDASNQNTNNGSFSQGQTESSTNDVTNETINNAINASATSGDASVEHNLLGGNATSGSAEVSVNLLNILNSNVSLSGWFGILFINVFGNWSGNFGIVTPPTTSSSSDANATNTSDGGVVLADSIAREAYTIFDQSSIVSPTPGQVLGATTNSSVGMPNGTVTPTTATVAHTSRAWWLPALAGFILAAASLGLEQIIQRSRKQNSQT